MNLLASLLLLTALTIQTPTLVLRSGKRIAVDGAVRVENRLVLFRSSGSLYSIPSDEVDMDATRAAATTITSAAPADTAKLRVNAAERERLLRNLEENHAGTPASKEQMDIPPAPQRPASERTSEDEWTWRDAARQHEEEVRRAKEQLALLQNRAAELRSQISGFISQGYKPSQFSYQTTLLASIEEQIPQAELEVRRAERSQQQFLDDARRKGILPGWLR